MIDRRTRHASRVGGQRVMTQNPSLVCAKPPHHVRVKIDRVLRRAESILCDQRGLEARTRSRRSMFGSTCELCLVLSPWRRRSTEESKRVHDAPILAAPGSAWNGQAAGSREAVQPVLHTWLVVCGDEPVSPCDRLHAADSLGQIAWNEGFQAPEESLGLGLGEISAWPCAVVCPPLRAFALRAPFGPL